MQQQNPVWNFMANRRSRPLAALKAPGPDRATLAEMLELASRVPDHGKLEPWRFIVPGPQRRLALAATARDYGQKTERDQALIDKALMQFEHSPCVVIVIGSPKESEKIPAIEQTLTCGAVCLSLVNAALSGGWSAVWLSGWLAHDRGFAEAAFGLSDHEYVAGLIHIGSCDTTPPERPRPALDAITDWQE